MVRMQCGRLVVLTTLAISGLGGRLAAEEDWATEAKAPRYRLIEIGTFGGPASLVFWRNGQPESEEDACNELCGNGGIR
jgi:hypothetical protein